MPFVKKKINILLESTAVTPDQMEEEAIEAEGTAEEAETSADNASQEASQDDSQDDDTPTPPAG